MGDGRSLKTVVADTSALVSLAVPGADEGYDDETHPDPLVYLLSSCSVHVPETVVAELENTAEYDDIHGAAAHNVLSARNHYAVENPYGRSDAPDARPTLGLNDSETDCVVLANVLGADALIADEFADDSFALLHAALNTSALLTTPSLLRDYVRNGHMSGEEARHVIETVASHRSWEENPYVELILDSLED